MRSAFLTSTAVAITMVASAAFAQGTAAAPEAGLEEIVVTAQRRAENVQDVPIAISAFTATELASRGVNETLDLIQYVPNMFGSNNTGLGSANAYYLRGLGNTETIATFDPPVGTYVDDVYLSRQNGNNFGFFDVERVEVLRGPQGTLFGRNTTGGAVNVILKGPADEFGGFAEVGYGRFDKKFARGSVDLPISDKFAMKLSGYYQNDDGYVKNTTTNERINDSDGAGLRGAVRLNVTENITWNAAVAWTSSDGENVLNFDCDPANTTNCKGRFVTTGMRETFTGTGSPYAPVVVTGRKAFFDFGNDVDQWLVTSNLAIEGENHTLNFITGVVDLKQKFALDFFDGRGGPNLVLPNPTVQRYARGGFAILNDGHHKQFTQEIKLNGKLFDGFIDYVSGIYVYDEKNRTDFADLFSLSPALTLLLADRTLSNKTSATAGYAQFDANFSDTITGTVGIRYTDETKKLNVVDNRAACAVATPGATCLVNANLTAANGVVIPPKLTTKLWTPRFALNWKMNEDSLFFVSATRGFKSGGWNARATTPSQLLPFEPEKVWSYELGSKVTLFDNKLRINATVFRIDAKDLQTPSALVNPATGAITFITQNFADYRNTGVEYEISAAPVDGLNLFLNIGYQKDNYKISNSLAPNAYGISSVLAQLTQCRAQRATGRVAGASGADNATACGAGIVTAQGNIATPVRTPTLTLSAGGSYDFKLGNGLVLTPSINASYQGKAETGTANYSIYSGGITVPGSTTVYTANPNSGTFLAGSLSKAHTIVNSSLTLGNEDKTWSATLECDNCFNETYVQSSLSNYTYINPPMTWMLRLRHNF